MINLNGKKLGNVEFIEKDGALFGRMKCCGTEVDYKINDVEPDGSVEAVLMDLDGTTLTSEEFWVYIIEETMKSLLGDKKFSLCEEDVPFVSGFTTVEHLTYCIEKYAQGKSITDANAIYHKVAKSELDKIMRGEGRTDAFKPVDGLKEFLTEIKSKNIKIGLATSGLDYKAIPEITAAFKTLNMGDPLKFYDSIITGGRRKDTGEYGTIGEIASKPHPWIYTELAYTGLRISNPKKVVGIEDSAAGVLSLRFAGFAAIGLENGNIGKSGMDSLCYRKVNGLADILKVLNI